MRYHFDSEPSNYREGYGWVDDREYVAEQPLTAILEMRKNASRTRKTS